MTATRQKKNKKQRGSHTHGWGAKKKHRGAGHRGGRGNAGTGKRGDANKSKIWDQKKYFGRHGFKKLSPSFKAVPINVSQIQEKLEKYVEQKLIEKKGDSYIIDVKQLGYNTVLGSGKITAKMEITAEKFSAKAEEKILTAGGKVNKPKEEPKKEKSKETPEKKEKTAPKEAE